MKNKNLSGQRIVDAARGWIGTPYLHQASAKGYGCDCLGLVRGIWRELVGKEPQPTPAYSSGWAETGGKELLLAAASAHFNKVETVNMAVGDLILFRLRARSPAKHLGIVSGTDHFIHAYQGALVVESALSEFWRRNIHSVFRFPGVQS